MLLRELLEDLEQAMVGLDESSSYAKALRAHHHAMKNPSFKAHHHAARHLLKAAHEIEHKMRGTLKKHGVQHPATAQRRHKLTLHGPKEKVGYGGQTYHDPGALRTHAAAHLDKAHAMHSAGHKGTQPPNDQAGFNMRAFGHGTHAGAPGTQDLAKHRRAMARPHPLDAPMVAVGHAMAKAKKRQARAAH